MSTAPYKRRAGEVQAAQVDVWSDVQTLAGQVTAAPGDYIVLDAEGSPAYVIEREVFEAAYEPAAYEPVSPPSEEVAPTSPTPPAPPAQEEEGLPPIEQPVSPAESPAPPMSDEPPAEAGPGPV